MDSYENKETKPFRPAVLSFVESLDSKCSNMETYGICSNMEIVLCRINSIVSSSLSERFHCTCNIDCTCVCYRNEIAKFRLIQVFLFL